MKYSIRVFLSILYLLVLFAAPTLTLAGSVKLTWQANSEPDLHSYNVYFGTQSRNYGPPIPVDQNPTHTVSGLTEGNTYYFAVTAVDTSGNESGYSEEISESIPLIENRYQLMWSPNDRSNPTSLDSAVIAGDGYIFLSPETSVVQVEYVIDGQPHNTERYAPFDVGEPVHTTTLTDGTHVISTRVTLGNGSTLDFDTTCTVANAQSPPPDTTAPEILITDPTSGGTFTTSSDMITLAGTASDNQSLEQVTWATSSGGSGTASGTARWTIRNLPLVTGQNTITVSAMDTNGNTGHATLIVEFRPTDTVSPLIEILSPTSSDTFAAAGSNSIAMSGTASDDNSIAEIRWSTSLDQSGIAAGTSSWSISGIDLADGLTTITVTATDRAGNAASDTLTVSYRGADTSDTIDPTVQIESPTTRKSYFARTNTVTIGGSASDNVDIVKVMWHNSRGESGTCSGTGSWQASNIMLNRWWNTITVTAIDSAGNTSESSLRVFRWR